MAKLTTTDAASLLGVDGKTVRNWIEGGLLDGTIGPTKAGNRRHFSTTTEAVETFRLKMAKRLATAHMNGKPRKGIAHAKRMPGPALPTPERKQMEQCKCPELPVSDTSKRLTALEGQVRRLFAETRGLHESLVQHNERINKIESIINGRGGDAGLIDLFKEVTGNRINIQTLSDDSASFQKQVRGEIRTIKKAIDHYTKRDCDRFDELEKAHREHRDVYDQLATQHNELIDKVNGELKRTHDDSSSHQIAVNKERLDAQWKALVNHGERIRTLQDFCFPPNMDTSGMASAHERLEALAEGIQTLSDDMDRRISDNNASFRNLESKITYTRKWLGDVERNVETLFSRVKSIENLPHYRIRQVVKRALEVLADRL